MDHGSVVYSVLQIEGGAHRNPLERRSKAQWLPPGRPLKQLRACAPEQQYAPAGPEEKARNPRPEPHPGAVALIQ